MIFIVWKVQYFLWDSSSSPYPNTPYFIISNISVNSMNSKCVFSEMIKPLEKWIFHIASMRLFNPFPFIFYIFNIPDRKTCWVIILPKEIYCFCFILLINKQCFKIIEIKSRCRKIIQRVFACFLYLGHFYINIIINYIIFYNWNFNNRYFIF